MAAILRDGKPVQVARVGDKVEVVLSETCFYVESGGQVSDTGSIAAFPARRRSEPVWEIRVDDMRGPIPGLVLHRRRGHPGHYRVGERAWALVDYERRMDIARNHTATHLLHHEPAPSWANTSSRPAPWSPWTGCALTSPTALCSPRTRLTGSCAGSTRPS